MTRAKKLAPAGLAARSGPAGGESELSGLSTGQRIAFLRGRHRQSQKTLSELVGRSESWLSKVERGERSCHDLEVILELAAVLRVSPATLIDIDLNAVPEGSRSPDTGRDDRGRRGPSVAAAGWAAGIKHALDAVTAGMRRLESDVEDVRRHLLAQHGGQNVVLGHGALPVGVDGGQRKDATIAWLIVAVDGEDMWVPMRLPRRRALTAGGATVLAWLTHRIDPDELGRVEVAIDDPQRVDLPVVAHLEALLAEYRRLDDVIGPRRLIAPVRSTCALVDLLCKGAASTVRQALLSLSAQYQQELGWLYADSGDHAKSQSAYDEAITQAAGGGNHMLAGYVLARKSDQALEDGLVDPAVKLAQAAQDDTRQLTPAVHAYAAMTEARGWALAGNGDACRRKLDQATGLLGESAANGRINEPPWIYWLGRPTLDAYRGICLTDLGEADRAIEIFDCVLPALPAEQVRDRAYYLSWAARAHVGNNDPVQGCVVAGEAAQIAIETGSGDVIKGLAGLNADLQAWPDVRAVQEFGDLLRSASRVSVQK